MARQKRTTPLAPVNVRMEPELLDRLKEAAKRDDRSVNSYVNALVRRQLRTLMPDQMDRLEGRRGGKR